MISREQIEDLATTLGGVPVLGCLPGSTSAKAGVRYGDIVLAINGKPCPNITSYLENKKLRDDGFQLRLFRDGQELEVWVPFGPSMSPVEMVTALAESRVVGPAGAKTEKVLS